MEVNREDKICAKVDGLGEVVHILALISFSEWDPINFFQSSRSLRPGDLLPYLFVLVKGGFWLFACEGKLQEVSSLVFRWVGGVVRWLRLLTFYIVMIL